MQYLTCESRVANTQIRTDRVGACRIGKAYRKRVAFVVISARASVAGISGAAGTGEVTGRVCAIGISGIKYCLLQNSVSNKLKFDSYWQWN